MNPGDIVKLMFEIAVDDDPHIHGTSVSHEWARRDGYCSPWLARKSS
jgi:hypothetical protein